jgi:hypothetical protein
MIYNMACETFRFVGEMSASFWPVFGFALASGAIAQSGGRVLVGSAPQKKATTTLKWRRKPLKLLKMDSGKGRPAGSQPGGSIT